MFMIANLISSLSLGGLHEPTVEFLNYMKQFEEEFEKFHGSTLNLGQDPIGNLALCLEACFPEIPQEVLNLYSKTRFFIRMKHLNKVLLVEQNTYRKRHGTHLAQLRN